MAQTLVIDVWFAFLYGLKAETAAWHMMLGVPAIYRIVEVILGGAESLLLPIIPAQHGISGAVVLVQPNTYLVVGAVKGPRREFLERTYIISNDQKYA